MEVRFAKEYTGSPNAMFAKMEDWIHAAIPGAKGSIGHLIVELEPDEEKNEIVLSVKGPPEHVVAYMTAFNKVSGEKIPVPPKHTNSKNSRNTRNMRNTATARNTRNTKNTKNSNKPRNTKNSNKLRKTVRLSNNVGVRPTWRRHDAEHLYERSNGGLWLPLGSNENTIRTHRAKVNAESTAPIQGLVSFLSDKHKASPSTVARALRAKRIVEKDMRRAGFAPDVTEAAARATFTEAMRSHTVGVHPG